MIKEAIISLYQKKDLEPETMAAVMNEIMSGEASDAAKGAFLTALAMKGETIEEITEAVKVMRTHCVRFAESSNLLEIVGTGGDRANTFNISTLSAIVCAAAGQPVAKHGNRAASSRCGTADCFEALGANLNMEPDQAFQVLQDTNIIFLFAQKYHPAMRFVGGVRKEIGIPTIFNVLGPLTNPAGSDIQLMGVYAPELVEPLAKVLHNVGVKRAMIVYGTDCLDEISLSAPTNVAEYIGDSYRTYTIQPEDFGLTRCKKEDLVGGDPQENAKIAMDILEGQTGPKRDVVLLNAGAALYLSGLATSIQKGVDLAAQTIDSGAAKKKLLEFVAATNA